MKKVPNPALNESTLGSSLQDTYNIINTNFAKLSNLDISKGETGDSSKFIAVDLDLCLLYLVHKSCPVIGDDTDPVVSYLNENDDLKDKYLITNNNGDVVLKDLETTDDFKEASQLTDCNFEEYMRLGELLLFGEIPRNINGYPIDGFSDNNTSNQIDVDSISKNHCYIDTVAALVENQQSRFINGHKQENDGSVSDIRFYANWLGVMQGSEPLEKQVDGSIDENNVFFNNPKIEIINKKFKIFKDHFKDFGPGKVLLAIGKGPDGWQVKSSLPMIFIDPRFRNRDVTDADMNDDIEIGDAEDISGVMIYNNEGFKVSEAFPQLYYNQIDKKYYWKINGIKTSVPATGASGKAGESSLVRLVVAQGLNRNTFSDQIKRGTGGQYYAIKRIIGARDESNDKNESLQTQDIINEVGEGTACIVFPEEWNWPTRPIWFSIATLTNPGTDESPGAGQQRQGNEKRSVFISEDNMFYPNQTDQTTPIDMSKYMDTYLELPTPDFGRYHARGLMVPIGTPYYNDDPGKINDTSFASHIIYSDAHGFIEKGKPCTSINAPYLYPGNPPILNQGAKYVNGDNKRILHIGSIADYRTLNLMDDRPAVPGKIADKKPSDTSTPMYTYNALAGIRIGSELHIDEPTTITRYRDTVNDNGIIPLLNIEGDVVIGPKQHVNSDEIFDRGGLVVIGHIQNTYGEPNPQGRPSIFAVNGISTPKIWNKYEDNSDPLLFMSGVKAMYDVEIGESENQKLTINSHTEFVNTPQGSFFANKPVKFSKITEGTSPWGQLVDGNGSVSFKKPTNTLPTTYKQGNILSTGVVGSTIFAFTDGISSAPTELSSPLLKVVNVFTSKDFYVQKNVGGQWHAYSPLVTVGELALNNSVLVDGALSVKSYKKVLDAEGNEFKNPKTWGSTVIKDAVYVRGINELDSDDTLKFWPGPVRNLAGSLVLKNNNDYIEVGAMSDKAMGASYLMASQGIAVTGVVDNPGFGKFTYGGDKSIFFVDAESQTTTMHKAVVRNDFESRGATKLTGATDISGILNVNSQIKKVDSRVTEANMIFDKQHILQPLDVHEVLYGEEPQKVWETWLPKSLEKAIIDAVYEQSNASWGCWSDGVNFIRFWRSGGSDAWISGLILASVPFNDFVDGSGNLKIQKQIVCRASVNIDNGKIIGMSFDFDINIPKLTAIDVKARNIDTKDLNATDINSTNIKATEVKVDKINSNKESKIEIKTPVDVEDINIKRATIESELNIDLNSTLKSLGSIRSNQFILNPVDGSTNIPDKICLLGYKYGTEVDVVNGGLKNFKTSRDVFIRSFYQSDDCFDPILELNTCIWNQEEDITPVDRVGTIKLHSNYIGLDTRRALKDAPNTGVNIKRGNYNKSFHADNGRVELFTGKIDMNAAESVTINTDNIKIDSKQTKLEDGVLYVKSLRFGNSSDYIEIAPVQDYRDSGGVPEVVDLGFHLFRDGGSNTAKKHRYVLVSFNVNDGDSNAIGWVDREANKNTLPDTTKTDWQGNRS